MPEDAVKSLRERLPNVGVFVSTSAEAEVFEWAELGAGIFSHAVRSGLLGAADANGDGVVTYDELKAFVAVTTSQVKNPLYRPKVFASGPDGDGTELLFRPKDARATRVEIDRDRQVRLTVRDGEDLPWIDLHKERSARMVIYLPPTIAARASFDEREVTDDRSRVIRRLALANPPADAVATSPVLHLTELAESPRALAARGPNEALRRLFAAPFGPRAMAARATTTEKDDEPVYGVSRDDVERMRLLLEQFATLNRAPRLVGGAAAIALGAGFMGVGAAQKLSNPNIQVGLPPLLIGLGTFSAGMGAYQLLETSEAERMYQWFVQGMASGSRSEAAILAETERRIFRWEREARRGRWLLFGTAAAFIPFGVFTAAQPETTVSAVVAHYQGQNLYVPVQSYHPEYPIIGVSMTVLCASIMYGSFFPTSVENLAKLWREDPGLKLIPRVHVEPYSTGTGLGLVGTF